MAQTARKVLKAFMNNVKEYEQLVNNQKERKKRSEYKEVYEEGRKIQERGRKKEIKLRGCIC